jgi:hypothetical protein
MFRRTSVILVTACGVWLASGEPAHAARKKTPPRCLGGYYVLGGEPLVAGASAPDALVVGVGRASTLSGCPPQTPRVFRSKRGRRGAPATDLLVVKWPSCGTVKRASLRAEIDADCNVVTGTFKAKGQRRRRWTATDGIPANLREPWDTGTTPLPPDAQLVSPAEFLAASGNPGFRLVSPARIAADAAAAAAEDASNQATLDEFADAFPARAEYVSIGVDPADPDLAQTDDGNYILTIYDIDGNASQVVTQGPRYQRDVLAETIRRYPTQANQLAIYADRYEFAKANLDPGLPAVEDVAGMSAEEIAALNDGVLEQLPLAQATAPLPGESVPGPYPARCGLEIGAGDGTDGASTCTHTPKGLWNTATWPLKYYDTCIKSQAARGACVGFAITAGREIRVAKKYGRWVNLSEQHLYFMAKWTFQPAMYGDGLGGSRLLGQLFDAGYGQPLEPEWDYNPSNSRVDDADAMTYTNSCTGYAGDQAAYCSDTAHQGRILCMQAGAVVVCAIQGAPIVGTTVRTTEQPAELWDPKDPIRGLSNVIWTLKVPQVPVVISLDVVKSLDTPNNNGFVTYHPNRAKVCGTDPASGACLVTFDCECSRGGHSALAVGYIPEANLPEGTPESTGGFLIIKNSWGCSGDGGYYYLPASWVRTFVKSARPVGDVETSAPLPDQPFDVADPFDYTPVPPSVHIVQPTIFDAYVAGQGVPLSLEGADFQYDRYQLLGQTTWLSDLQGVVGTGANTVATFTQGTHQLTATYTGKTGAGAMASTTVFVGPQPANLPPTPLFSSYSVIPNNQCPEPCDLSCVVGFGEGSDPEDGLLTAPANVRWYAQTPFTPKTLSSSGASPAGQGKFLTCARLCGGLFRFTLEVQDSNGQSSEARRELFTADCVN